MPFRWILVVYFLAAGGCQSKIQQASCVDPSFQLIDSTLSPADFNELDAPPYDNDQRESLATDYLRKQCSRVEKQEISKRNGNNLICRLAGKSKSRIIVGAHYDRIGPGSGVADNWTGIVLIKRLAAAISENSQMLTWELVAFGAEENGLLGSKTYLRKDDGQGKILAMINIDTLGLGKVNIDSRSDDNLACIANDLARAMEIDVSRARMRQTTGDWEPFDRQGIPVLNLHSLNRKSIKKVHTRQDRRSAISDDDLNDAWRLLVNLQRYLDFKLSDQDALAQELKVRSN